jgi:hypothetical protein
MRVVARSLSSALLPVLPPRALGRVPSYWGVRPNYEAQTA